MADQRIKPSMRWTTASIGVVVLAVFLAAFGLFSAVSRIRLVSSLNIANVRNEAVDLRDSANRLIRQTTARMVQRAADYYQTRAKDDAIDLTIEPSWITTVFVWDGATLSRWPAGDTNEPGTRELDKLVRDRLRVYFDFYVPVLGTQPEYEAVSFQGKPVLLVWQMFRICPDRSIVVAVRIDPDRLRRNLLGGLFLFAATGKIRVVNTPTPAAAFWHERISPELDPLGIEPAPSYIAAERRGVVYQIAFYSVATALFLIAMAVLLSKFIRLVQREVALSRLRSNFVADVSHELKTPLTLIRMFGEMLSDDRVESEEKKKEYYRIITRESERLTHMIENILDFSRIEAGEKQFTSYAVDVGEIVRATYNAYRVNLDEHGFEHELSIADDLPKIYADGDAIGQAVLNLISNAIKYSHDDKKLAINVSPETRRGKHGVLISVEDSGIGIRPEDRHHLFDGFFRAEDERVRKKRGAGLGLSLVKSIVEAHGGSIDVESRLVKGTAFRIFLPVSAPVDEKGD